MNNFQLKINAINLKNVMVGHAVFCLSYGIVLLIIPHGFYKYNGNYNFLVHESSRVSQFSRISYQYMLNCLTFIF